MNYIKIRELIKKISPNFLFYFLINGWRNIFVSRSDLLKKNNLIVDALADPNGQGYLNLLLENASIPRQYKYLFKYSSESKIFVDCGANVGKVTDIARFCNMEVFAFEPNRSAIELLNKKYSNDNKVHLYPIAVSNKSGNIDFYSDQYNIYDQGASIVDKCNQHFTANQKYQVKCSRLIDVLNQDILQNNKRIYILKLDVEGAEFDILEDIIENKIYIKIDHIVCETHERFFGKEGIKKLEKIKNLIKDKNIQNIYLDWI